MTDTTKARANLIAALQWEDLYDFFFFRAWNTIRKANPTAELRDVNDAALDEANRMMGCAWRPA